MLCALSSSSFVSNIYSFTSRHDFTHSLDSHSYCAMHQTTTNDNDNKIVCGTEKGALNMTDYPYLYYVNDYSGGVCVKECPTFPGGFDPYTLVTYDGLYRATATSATNEGERISLPDYSSTNNTLICTSELCYPDANDPQSAYTSLGVNRGMGFAYFAVDTYELMWRCVFTAAGKAGLQAIINPNNNSSNYNNGTAAVEEEEEEFDTTMDPIIEASTMTQQKNEIIKAGYRLWNNLYSDIWMTRYYILTFGFGLPLVVGFGYAYMMRLPGVLPILVWASIFATVGIFVGAGYYTSRIANTWKIAIPRVYTDREIEIAIYSSYGLYTVGGLLVLLFLFMRKRIQLAMGCVEETSKAMLQMPLILFFPVVQGLGFLVFMICWTVYAVSIASMGEFQTTTYTATSLQISVRSFEFSDFVVKCGWYMLFSFFWTGQFILALGQVVFAMAVSKWYFARDKSTIGSGTVLSSISTSIIYHSGTAAFGALIIACIKMIRSCIAYLQRKAEEMNSGIAKCILCCFQCCFLCLEKCMKFMNKNAYIQTAIFGSSFCTSAKEAFFLILRCVLLFFPHRKLCIYMFVHQCSNLPIRRLFGHSLIII